MFLRYFACTDESPLGHTAAAYCDALVATSIPVRLVPTKVAELQTEPGVRFDSVWDKYRNLLVTPMDGDFINFVCGEIKDWTGYYTSNATNALLISTTNFGDVASDPAREAIWRYEHVFVTTECMVGRMSRTADILATMISLGTPEAANAFRSLKVF